MQFRLTTCGLLLIIPLTYTHLVFAETSMPLDLIELLGEMEDDDYMLETALLEMKQKQHQAQINHKNKQDNQQNSDLAVPAGDDKK